MRTLLLGTFGCLFATLAVGCTITTSDAPLDDAATDTAVPADDGVDTLAADTGTPDGDAAPSFAVIVRANDLVGGVDDDVRDYGGGSTRLDIQTGGRIAYAIAKYESGSTVIESNPIGNATSGGGRVDGRLVGLPTGSEVTITVTGYLRGLNGNGADKPMTRIPWARTTCKATPSATADVYATCATKLELIPGLAGIVFSSDVLPPDYCAGKGATDFELLRARIPTSGDAVVSKTTDDCLGVVFVPESEFLAQEVNGVTYWGLSVEAKSSATACSMKDPFCKVDRGTGAEKAPIYIVGESCRLSATNTSGTCF